MSGDILTNRMFWKGGMFKKNTIRRNSVKQKSEKGINNAED